MRTTNQWITVLGTTALTTAIIQLHPPEVTASDHMDAPMTISDAAADIGDFYAWPTSRGTIVAIVTFASALNPTDGSVYDPDVLYTINIDNTAAPGADPSFLDNQPDIQIHARFGQNEAGQWGVQLSQVPGADDDVFAGPVGFTINNGSARAIAGLFDDPFFFDQEGLMQTLTNLVDPETPEDLVFEGLASGLPADSRVGLNAMAIVVEFDAPMAVAGNSANFVRLWATTGRPSQ